MAEPLKNYNDAITFVRTVSTEGSDNPDLANRIQETIGNTEIPPPIRVFILNEIRENFAGRYIGLEFTINDGIRDLLEQSAELKDSPGYNDEMNSEMKLAHMLWLSQTVGCSGTELKETWNESCLESICGILKHQKNGNKRFADVLHQHMENVLKAKNIEMGQFEP